MNEALPVASPVATAQSSPADDITPTLMAWAMEELAAFRLHKPDPAQITQRFLALNKSSVGIYIYAFSGGSVTLLDKPEGAATNPTGERRSRAYLDFFRAVCRLLPDAPPFHLALETGDKVTGRFDVPIFTFQKRRGDSSILLPDIDFLNHDFYAAPRYQDTRAYRNKLEKAIFVGSTSGGRVTPDVARTCSLPRLRAARYFDGNPRVSFLLPQIVQTSGEDAAEILQQMAFCQSAYMPFSEQLRYRFVISMDGNGATCSRVAITLKSNSVLLKYDSDDLLYYFRHLQPWLHYVPVQRDADIEQILDMEQNAPMAFENIAEAGRRFAETYLSRDAVHAYTAELFSIYAAGFSNTSAPARPVPRPPVARPIAPATLSLRAHVAGRGDVSAEGDGWIGDAKEARSIEGFSFTFDNPKLNAHVFCSSLAEDGAKQPSLPAGAFCGTRGKATPMRGFVIDTAAEAADLPSLDYEGIFLDGFVSGKLMPGALCRSPRGAPLVAMRIGVATG